MADPAHSRRLFVLLAGLLLAGAALLRFAQIDRRLLHADEAVQAYQTWQLVRGDGYTYDPADKHGPLLYYAAAGLAKITGQTPSSLTATKLRGYAARRIRHAGLAAQRQPSPRAHRHLNRYRPTRGRTFGGDL